MICHIMLGSYTSLERLLEKEILIISTSLRASPWLRAIGAENIQYF